MKTFLLTLLVILGFSSCFAQTSFFNKIQNKFIYDIKPCNDSEYVFCEKEYTFPNIYPDIFQAMYGKLDNAGNIIWYKVIGGDQDEYFNHVYVTHENGNEYYIFSGQTLSFDNPPPMPGTLGTLKGYILKVNVSGDTLWTKAMQQSGFVGLFNLQNGTYLMPSDGQNTVLMKLNALTGDTISSIPFFYWYSNAFVFNTSPHKVNNAFYIGGNVVSNATQNTDFMLIKTDTLYNTIWAKGYGNNEINVLRDIQPTPDGGFLLSGSSNVNEDSLQDYLVIKVDSGGNYLWSKSFDDGVAADYFSQSTVLSSNDYLIAGYSFKWINPVITYDAGHAILFDLDSLGNLKWAKDLGKGFGDCIYNTNDGGIVMSLDDKFLKTDSSLYACYETPATMIENQFPIVVTDLTVLNQGGGLPYYQSTWSTMFIDTLNAFDYCTWLSVNNPIKEDLEICIYPNPILNQLTVGSLQLANKDVAVTVYDVLGKQKLQSKTTVSGDGKIEMDVTALESGVYFLQFVLQGKIQNAKFIKE